MSLVTLKEVLDKAYKEKYAVPAFNFWTHEDAKAIVRGAEEMKSPVILMSSGSCIKGLGLELAAFTIQHLAKYSKVPVVLHLDHADNLDLIFRAMKCGYTGIMYDGSMLDVEENIKNTILVIKVAHALGISVEAEIGRVGRGEEGQIITEILTEPEAAAMFFEKTGVDALAVAIGTSHGMQKQEAKIHYEIVQGLTNAVNAPLVLHGSSGVKDEDLIRLSKTAFSKINIGTKLKSVYVEGMRKALADDPSTKDSSKILAKASEMITQTVMEKISLLGSKNKA
jgi:fructose-bisphosphate aldolase class II